MSDVPAVAAVSVAEILLNAAKRVPHSHRDQDPRHPQMGNLFYDWWGATRFLCPLCLAVMAADGIDISLEFTRQLPYRVEYHFDIRWWKKAYLATLPYVTDRYDREWMHEGLASALRRGREARSG